jgi:transcriptional regulator with XRE-family HTH domain
MVLQQIFMTNMKKSRKQAGLTQEKLAELCNTDPCYIRQIETGRRFPSLTYIERIASALNIAPYQLFYSDENISGKEEHKQKMEMVLIERVSQTIRHAVEELY